VPTQHTAWIRLGLLALPVYGLLTFWDTLTHQPDMNADFEAYARYISTTYYLIDHLVVSIGGTILAIFGAISLGVYLAESRAGRMGLFAMVSSVAGSSLILTIRSRVCNKRTLISLSSPVNARACSPGGGTVRRVRLSTVAERSPGERAPRGKRGLRTLRRGSSSRA
jgi:hypothetical protein